MRRCNERSSDAGPLLPRQFCPAYIIDTRGYDFREGQECAELSFTWAAVSMAVERVNAELTRRRAT